MYKMETLPRDLLFDLLLYLKNSHLLNLCNSNKQLYNFCDESNERFWQQKVYFDYQNQPIPPKPNNLSWKRFYIQLGTNHFKQIPIYYDEELIGHIWISRDDTTQKILDNSNNLFRLIYPDDYPADLRNKAALDSPNRLYWYKPLHQYIHKDKPLSRDMYNTINELIYRLYNI